MHNAIIGQYLAALGMLNATLEACSDELWDASVGRHPFWLIAYHTLYFTDLYLAGSEAAFRPPEFGRPDEHSLDGEPDEPHSRADLLQYLTTCCDRVRRIVGAETDESLSVEADFDWIPFSRFELHLYNIRHIQHHAAQLSLELKFQTGNSTGWVASGFPE